MPRRKCAVLFLVTLSSLLLIGCNDQDLPGKDGLQVVKQVEELRLLLDKFNAARNSTSGELSVQLVFTSDVDLDLYVTDPLLETVYFANAKSKSGGEITEDIMCNARQPRIEEVVFKTPLPGRYRIGVDFPERCEGNGKSALYIVAATRDGNKEEAAGSVLFQQFKIVAMEFETDEKGNIQKRKDD